MSDLTRPPDGDVDKGPMLKAITWSECGVALALVLARVWTRTRLIKQWGWDDAFICLAVACAAVNSVCTTIGIYHGTGRHIYYLNDYQKVQANKFNWISQGFHVMSTNWGKVSVAVFLLRIMGRERRRQVIFGVGMVLLTIVNSVCVYTIYGQCTPTTALWEGQGPGKGTCWNPNIQRNYAFFQGSFSALSDLVLAIYPVFIIWNLQMARKLKIGLTCVLALGVFATAAAIVKTIYLSQLTARSDYTFDTVELTTWIATEQYLIIIAACIPTLGPLFNLAMDNYTSRRTGSYGRYQKGSRSVNRPYFPHHNGPSAASSGFRKKRRGDMQSYTLDEYTCDTTAWTTRPWSGANDRQSDASTEAIVPTTNDTIRTPVIPDVSDHHTGIMKTMEVHVKSDPQDGEDRRNRYGHQR